MSDKLLDQAIQLAVEAHSGAKRKGTDIPYIVHPLEVVAIVATMTRDEKVLTAAVLHDVVEDTPFSLEDIRARFGQEVATYVAAESENKREGQSPENSWKIRKQETLDDLKSACPQVKMITLGDKLSNIRAIARDYDQIGEDLWQRFNQKDKAQHAWYYQSICRLLAPDLEAYPAYQEFKGLVDRVFA